MHLRQRRAVLKPLLVGFEFSCWESGQFMWRFLAVPALLLVQLSLLVAYLDGASSLPLSRVLGPLWAGCVAVTLIGIKSGVSLCSGDSLSEILPGCARCCDDMCCCDCCDCFRFHDCDFCDTLLGM